MGVPLGELRRWRPQPQSPGVQWAGAQGSPPASGEPRKRGRGTPGESGGEEGVSAAQDPGPAPPRRNPPEVGRRDPAPPTCHDPAFSPLFPQHWEARQVGRGTASLGVPPLPPPQDPSSAVEFLQVSGCPRHPTPAPSPLLPSSSSHSES